MSRTLLSVDLDWLNGADDPIRKLNGVLNHIPQDIPAIMTVEHHEFLPQLREWIKSGKVKTPFNVLNLDEHHDYYTHSPPHHPCGLEINCGNWGYRLLLEWYNRYTWVHNGDTTLCDWEHAKLWLANSGISFSKRAIHRLGTLKSEIVAVVFCVSPDYLTDEMQDKIAEAIEIVVHRFKLPEAPLEIKNTNISEITGWRIARRPLKVR